MCLSRLDGGPSGALELRLLLRLTPASARALGAVPGPRCWLPLRLRCCSLHCRGPVTSAMPLFFFLYQLIENPKTLCLRFGSHLVQAASTRSRAFMPSITSLGVVIQHRVDCGWGTMSNPAARTSNLV